MNTHVGNRWLRFVLLGIASIALGAFAWIDAISVTLASTVLFGVIFIIAGAFQLAHAFSCREWSSRLLSALLGCLYILGGMLLIEEPATGSAFITAFIAISMVIGGAVRSMIAFQNRALSGWWMMMLGGLVTIAIGVMLYATLPWSGLWLVGTLIACELIFAGIGWVQFGLALRRGTVVIERNF
ncbi:HdeD family acid-resistance protein [Acetobacter conturbans]|uniref:HdeD family acid-resistance protein n=1 Tax=Acetobacter conturbans TaxID=1737472 RepID=A0ABX0K158_9PROT|nr:HdeD family acid-resistance protein [Acetobacter conturbans]NHN88551.1 HdeD family acid-resistance protein [Acetobacter conturbans]